MCAIAGILDKSGRLGGAKLAELARSMVMAMAHRGPDDMGVWLSPDGRCALSQRRLAIIDLSPAGHQPMASRNGGAVITFNGEIYNFSELRAELEAKGVEFRSRSDTEVLLELLGREGVDCLPRLDAMFAFGLYDVRARRLLLARDMFGEKPLYYVDRPEYFAFASELHALAGLPGFDCTVDQEAIAAYLAYLYIPQPETIYRSARKLPPGAFMRADADGASAPRRYFSFQTSSRRSSARSLDDLADELEHLLATSVRRRLVSDVPVGAFLSGGVDSSTVAAIAVKKLGAELKTFSIGFLGHPNSEHHDAAEVSRMLGTHHADRVLDPRVFELGRHIGAVLDEPNGDSSCLPTFVLSEFAREKVTVALSGDGGDELFGGYGRYFVTVDEWERHARGARMPPWWSPGAAYLSSRLLTFPEDEITTLLGASPPAFKQELRRCRDMLNHDPRPPINVLREFDASSYMPGAVLAKVDRMSMQHALEVRAPLLGTEIARFAADLGGDACYADGVGKAVLKQLARRYLPPAWIDRPKRGFGLPETLWGASELMPIVREMTLGRDARLPEWMPRERLAAFVQSLEANFHSYQAWALFILESWLRTHPAKPGARPAVAWPSSWRAHAALVGADIARSAARATRTLLKSRQ